MINRNTNYFFCRYRVQIQVLKIEKQSPYVTFNHPVLPGTQGGGFLVPVNEFIFFSNYGIHILICGIIG